MQAKDPHYQERVRKILTHAPFIQDLGITLTTLEPGHCITELSVLPKFLQQDGFIHAGIQATIADHSAGAAAATLIPADQIILTLEFKINLLRPAQGSLLVCEAHVLRPGKTVIVCESTVSTVENQQSKMVAKAIVTLAVTQLS